MKDNKRIIEDLRETLKNERMSQRQFAISIGVGIDAVCNWLQYKRKPSNRSITLIESFINKHNKKGESDETTFTKRIRKWIGISSYRNGDFE